MREKQNLSVSGIKEGVKKSSVYVSSDNIAFNDTGRNMDVGRKLEHRNVLGSETLLTG